MQNRLLTIHLEATAYQTGGIFSHTNVHGLIEEHLKPDLEQGWLVKSADIACGSSEHGAVRGWVVVVLEKP